MVFGEEARRLAGAAALLLGWTSDAFWRATPAELMAALTPTGGQDELADRKKIEALMERFPDARR